MFTTSVREKLWRDYGIRDIPHELLEYLIRKEKTRYEREKEYDVEHCGLNPEHVHMTPTAACMAFIIANVWQKGLTTPSV